MGSRSFESFVSGVRLLYIKSLYDAIFPHTYRKIYIREYTCTCVHTCIQFRGCNAGVESSQPVFFSSFLCSCATSCYQTRWLIVTLGAKLPSAQNEQSRLLLSLDICIKTWDADCEHPATSSSRKYLPFLSHSSAVCLRTSRFRNNAPASTLSGLSKRNSKTSKISGWTFLTFDFRRRLDSHV